MIIKRILRIQSPSKQLIGAYDEFEKKQTKSKTKKLEEGQSFHQLLKNEQNKLENLK